MKQGHFSRHRVPLTSLGTSDLIQKCCISSRVHIFSRNFYRNKRQLNAQILTFLFPWQTQNQRVPAQFPVRSA